MRLPKGQEWAIETALYCLRRGRVAQAQLIVGPLEADAMVFAEVMAMAQFCDRLDAGACLPCGDCYGCLGVIKRTHPDLHWTAAEGTLGIDEVRAIAAASQVRPAVGAANVFVIEACERLTGPAAAALLKTLEDPPGAALFILTASAPAQMEPTLCSRCLPLRLRPMSAADLVPWLLQQQSALAADEAEAIVHMAGGWPGRALAIAQRWPSSRDAPPWLAQLVAGLLAGTSAEAAVAAAELASASASPETALAVLRDTLVYREDLSSRIGSVSGLDVGDIETLSAAYSQHGLGLCLEACMQALQAADANVNASLNWYVLFIRLQRLRRSCYAPTQGGLRVREER